jgi:hypothetical protein
MKRVLVIRGNGKVHKPLVRALLERGIAVRVLTRRAERARGAHPLLSKTGEPRGQRAESTRVSEGLGADSSIVPPIVAVQHHANARVAWGNSWGSGGAMNGSSIHAIKSRCVNRFMRSSATRLAMLQPKRDDICR